jgi:catechol 2,3-dioxygenase-like lactoylglutathione lyase family enzyme
MTSIGGYIERSRRPGELGVHSTDHFGLVVPDLAVAQKFYESFGLDVREESNNIGLYTYGSDHRCAVISEGSAKRLNYLSFGVFEDDFERFKVHVEKLGHRLVDPPRGSNSNGLWLHDHDGVLIELRVAAKTSPDTKSPSINVSCPAGMRGTTGRLGASPVRPRRMAHVLCFSTNIPGAINFYGRALGLRMTDRVSDGICFFHGIHGSDHHVLAFAKSNAPGLHHCSWDVGSIEEIGRGAMQMADRGYSRGWGLGRHVLGSNYFHYVRDPWGSHSEYSSGVDYIPADCDWNAKDHPPEDAFYVWGPNPPDDFIHNYEADPRDY